MRTVITYGTFDLFHQGHYNILKRAKEEGDYLIVGVTGETYDAERGKLSVRDSLATRIENVRKTGFADKIIVEEYLGQKIPDILKYHVDVLVIGSDWKGKFDHVSKYCEVKYLERTKNISSTQIREESGSIYRLGIVTDDLEDSDAVYEAQIVSGIHVEGVFAEDEAVAKEFCDKYELNQSSSDYDKFLKDVEIVYIKVKREKRFEYAKKALEKGKHVICDMPISLEQSEQDELEELSKKNNAVLFGNVMTIYQHAFGQLLWMARGNIIGDIINVRCSISKESFDETSVFDLLDLAYYPICAITKVLGAGYDDLSSKIVRDENGNDIYGMITFRYPNATAIAEIGTDANLDGAMVITGTDGEIVIPEDWWRVGYFKYKNRNEKRAKHYSSNFDGNGFRYLIQSLLRDVRDDQFYSTNITEDEAESILRAVNTIIDQNL